jgi:hypothetical protein
MLSSPLQSAWFSQKKDRDGIKATKSQAVLEIGEEPAQGLRKELKISTTN